jgi:serine/threonine protein kinase
MENDCEAKVYINPLPLYSGNEGDIHTGELNGKKVAVKIVDTLKNSEDSIIAMIKLWETFDHPNILKLLKWNQDSEKIYMFTDFTGRDLYTCIRRKAIPESDVLSITEDISNGLKYMHDLGVAHGDVKSDNIVIHDSVWKLIDFGYMEKGETTVNFKGTPLFTSPEQLTKVRYEIKPVDVWALGITIYEMLYTLTPFHKNNKEELYKAIKNGHVYYRGKIFSDRLTSIINNTLIKDPGKRWTIDDVLGALKADD